MTRLEKFILVGHEPTPLDDLLMWADWFGTADRHVGIEERDGIKVSTVFLGLDHNFLLDGPPLLFETMVFGGEFEGEQERYSTWDEAELGHRAMVAKVFAQVK